MQRCMYSIQMLLRFSQIAPRVCTLVLFIYVSICGSPFLTILFLLFLLVLILGFQHKIYNVRENEGNVKIIVEKKKSAIDGNITVRVETFYPLQQDNAAQGMLIN